jgi:hypothetical protein
MACLFQTHKRVQQIDVLLMNAASAASSLYGDEQEGGT